MGETVREVLEVPATPPKPVAIAPVPSLAPKAKPTGRYGARDGRRPRILPRRQALQARAATPKSGARKWIVPVARVGSLGRPSREPSKFQNFCDRFV